METEDIENQDMNNFHFNYSKGFSNSECSNSFIGPVSENLILRPSPKRKYSPKIFRCNPCIPDPCLANDICGYIYRPEPCDKCIHRHCSICHNEIETSSINESKNNCNNIYTSCQICHNFPCCCCSICHYYPCKCCPSCHSIQCKCCPKCNNFPCKCCPVCNQPKCICCPKCKKYPCICCPECHYLDCRCCNVCHKYPCVCCPNCHFPKCRCCNVCHKYPCVCCPNCHFPNCRCCNICHCYPCACCPNCHFPNCRCCNICHCYPCACCPNCHSPDCRCCNICHCYPCACCPNCHSPDCRCCNSCHNCPCVCCHDGKNYPCKCCPDCRSVNSQCCASCGCFPCKCIDPRCTCCQMCGQKCDDKPQECPFCHFDECKCPGCTCGKECAALRLNALNAMNCPLHNTNTMKHKAGCPFGPKCPHENGPKCAHPKKNDNKNNNSSNNNNNPNNSGPNNNCHHGYHPPFNMNNPHNFNNNSQNNNVTFNNNQNNNGPKSNAPKNVTYSYSEQNSNGPNNNDLYNNNNLPYDNNNGPNNNRPNNGPYNNPSGPFQNQNQNPNESNQTNPNNDTCPLTPVSSPYPPNSPLFNAEEGEPKSNWIFCPKCNVFHRCPHPGCEHNPNKRTTVHKCLFDDENQSQNNQNNNNNIPNSPQSFAPNQGPNDMGNPNSSQTSNDPNRKSRKRGVFESSPYKEELAQFVDFLGLLMDLESKIEDLKIELARREDFNFEDIFRIFEVDGKGCIEPDDLKQGLKLLGLNPSDFDIKLLMKRFDLNRQGLLSYTDFFDMVVSFEKRLRNTVQVRPPNSCCPCKTPDVFECDTLIAIKNLFKFIIECEKEINQRRANFGSLRSKFADVVQFLDYSRRGVINRSDLKLYLTQFNKFTTSKECDLLFIRLDKLRKGEVGIDQIEEELMFLR